MAEEKKEQEATQVADAPAQNEAQDKEVSIPDHLKGFVETIEKMSVMELADLVKVLEKKFGVSSTPAMGMMPMMAAMPGAAAAGGGEAAEEKTMFDVVLKEVGAQKIQVIKEIRAVTSLGLKEAKDLVEAAPKPVKEGVPKDEAEKIKAQLEKVGAKIEIK